MKKYGVCVISRTFKKCVNVIGAEYSIHIFQEASLSCLTKKIMHTSS